ncbi:coiled-coil domain-containing protein 96-like [Malaya genurostris]|uniref:coiled-coil domain-containing protein 96-like n=1 Tax=Malaya genurostris TaxID=325434 RepID=UPI0026F3FD44|nr:coiled-coil domain-containing protein 96-like [Malaya genurostris]
MPIVKTSERSKSCSSFSVLDALFGNQDATEASRTSSKTNTDQETPEISKLKESSQSDDDIRARLRQVSSVQRESLMVESFRKLSVKRFESQTIDLESEPPELEYRASEYQLLVETKHAQQLDTFNKAMELSYLKLQKLAAMTVRKSVDSKVMPSTESLLDRMSTARAALSGQRSKLIAVYRELEFLNRRNSQLDGQIKNIRLDELHDLQAEVSRTGEKIDETSKEMTKARTQYESDILKAAHVREKWFTFQNNILDKQDDLAEVQGNIVENRIYLCDLLERKQKLRRENFKLKKRCRIIENKPLLRKFDRMVYELQVIQQYTEKFRSI